MGSLRDDGSAPFGILTFLSQEVIRQYYLNPYQTTNQPRPAFNRAGLLLGNAGCFRLLSPSPNHETGRPLEK